MKIGIVTPGFSSSEADWCIPVMLDIVRQLARDSEIHVFSIRYPYRRDCYQVYGATVHPLGGARSAGLSRLPLLARTISLIQKEHQRSPFDILHGMWADEPGFTAVVAARLCGVPAIVSILGGELVRLREINYGGRVSALNRGLIQIALRGAVSVTAGSSYLARTASEFISRRKLIMMPLGVDIDLFRPSRQPPALQLEKQLVHSASLVPVKDHATLLTAFQRVAARMPKVRLHIVGQGPLRTTLEHQVSALQLQGNVTFHGAVRREQMVDIYQAADLCLLPSRHEAQGMVTLEAAACGRTTIGTAVGITPDLSPDTSTVPVANAPALADSILDTLGDPDGLKLRSGRVYNRVVEQYGLVRMVDELLGLYARSSGHPGSYLAVPVCPGIK